MHFPQTFIDDLRRQSDIVRVVQDYVPLKKKGANWMACCPFHSEKTPSFSVNPTKEIFYCFGCVEENELIWTRDGLKPIGAIHVGDHVLDKFGGWQQVVNVIRKSSDVLLNITTATFLRDPLWLTPDHTCIYVKREDVLTLAPYIFRTSEREMRFSGLRKRARRIAKYRSALKFTEGRADEMKEGDYLLFPVISEGERRAYPLVAECAVNPRENRINGVRVFSLPINERTARLYGIWLAEGSVGRGFARWTFHAKQKHTLAAEVISILKEEFGLPAMIYEYHERPNTCEVNCSKTDLACQLTHWFGRGAANKRLPAEALHWPASIQKAFLSGYRDGDGDKQKMSTSISRHLSYGIFALAIQAGENIALYRNDGYTDKTGLCHKEFWNHYPRKLESCKGFYESINDATYYFSPITRIERSAVTKRVVDITVSDTSSFTTKMGVVHNCGKGGSVFNFVMEMERVAFPEAVKIVAEKSGVPLPVMENNERFEARRQESDEVVKLNSWALEWWEEKLGEKTNESQVARDYIAGRSIHEETRRLFRLGYAPNSWDALIAHLKKRGASEAEIERSGLVVKKEKGGFYDRFRGRLIFPVLDVRGRPVAFGARAINPNDEPKYLNSPETAAYTKGRHLYGLFQAREEIKRKRFAILVEGYLDLIVPFQAGVRNAVASLGTALTGEQAKLLGRFARKVVVNYDGDRAGTEAAKRATQTLLAEDFEVKVLILPDNADPDEFIKQHGVEEYQKRRGASVSHIQFVLDQAMRDRHLGRPADKAAAVEEVLPSLRVVKNPVLKREYFDLAMDTLLIEPALRRELWQTVSMKAATLGTSAAVRAATARDGGARESATAARVETLQLTVAEQQLLELLVHDAELRGEILPRLDENDYKDLPTAIIFRYLKEANETSTPLDLAQLAEATAHDSIAENVVPLLMMSEPQRHEGEAIDDALVQAERCVVALKLMNVERRLRELAAEIAAAGRSGDAELLQQLTIKNSELTRRRSELMALRF